LLVGREKLGNDSKEAQEVASGGSNGHYASIISPVQLCHLATAFGDIDTICRLLSPGAKVEELYAALRSHRYLPHLLVDRNLLDCT